jgi:GNAT superfamily N-acetyltransferase
MSFQLRVATENDRPRIAALIARSVRGLQAAHYSPAQIEASLETIFTVDSTLLADRTYFLALAENGDLAACGGWSRRKTLYGGDHQLQTRKPELLDPAIDAARIRAMFVHPLYARQGLGTMILEASEAAAANQGFTRLEMGSTLTGVALYSLRGYAEVERLSVPVGRGESIAVVRMIKHLRP